MRPGCGRLLAAGLRPLLGCPRPAPPPPPGRGVAGRWPSPGLRVPEAAEAERLVQEARRAGGPLRRFIACPRLARTVQRCLGAARGPQPVVLECGPGESAPGPPRRAVTLRGRRGRPR